VKTYVQIRLNIVVKIGNGDGVGMGIHQMFCGDEVGDRGHKVTGTRGWGLFFLSHRNRVGMGTTRMGTYICPHPAL